MTSVARSPRYSSEMPLCLIIHRARPIMPAVAGGCPPLREGSSVFDCAASCALSRSWSSG